MKSLTTQQSILTIAAITLIGATALVIGPQTAASFTDGNGNGRSAFVEGLLPAVQINDEGETKVRGATVVSIGSGGVITADTAWGGSTIRWTVHTDADTEFVTRGGPNEGLAGIAVGDVISFRGEFDTESDSFTVRASMVKDWASKEDFDSDDVVVEDGGEAVSMKGKVESVNEADGSLVVKARGRDITVLIDTATSSATSTTITLDGVVAVLADLGEKDKVQVSGTLSTEGEIMADSIVARSHGNDDRDEDEDREEENRDENEENADEDEREDDDNENRGRNRGRGHGIEVSASAGPVKVQTGGGLR